jgi:hypothetical protein
LISENSSSEIFNGSVSDTNWSTKYDGSFMMIGNEIFLSELSVFAHDHLTTYSHFDVVSGLRYAMACSVQRGNALIALAGYANAVRISPDYA